jgi:bifunctional non-homologous end joining protein LigD
MVLLRTSRLPDNPQRLYEAKFDGYRAIGIKTGGEVQLRSRNNNDFTITYPTVWAALTRLTR